VPVSELNDGDGAGGACVLPDGLTIYFAAIRDDRASYDIYKATRLSTDDPFGNIELISISSDVYGEFYPFVVTADEGTLYFAQHWGGERGIYVSYWVVEPIAVLVDIKPWSCPNPINVSSRGVLPVAILGSDELDVSSIDVATIQFAGVGPIRSNYEDVASPVFDGNECDCNEEGPDGYEDLTLKFETEDIAEALLKTVLEPEDGDVFELSLTGTLLDGTPIEGFDCVVVRGKVPRSVRARRSDINEDGFVDMLDFALMSGNWLESAY
jgi:hypothetical protein